MRTDPSWAPWRDALAAHAAVADRTHERATVLAWASSCGINRDDRVCLLVGRLGPCADVALRVADTLPIRSALRLIAARARAAGAPRLAIKSTYLQAQLDRQLLLSISGVAWLQLGTASLPGPSDDRRVFERVRFLESILLLHERARIFDLMRRAFAVEEDEDQMPPERPEQRVPIPGGPERALPRETRAGPAERASATADEGDATGNLMEVAA